MESYALYSLTILVGLLGLAYGLYTKLIRAEAALNKAETVITMTKMSGDIDAIKKDIANIWEYLKKHDK